MLRSRLNHILSLSLVILAICQYAWALDALPRIAARSASPFAEFYNVDTGQKFTPTGNNYIRLDFSTSAPPHITLTTGFYDVAAAETALTKMAADGYNIVRVWVDSGFPAQRPSNFGAAGPQSTNVEDLYQPFLDNFIDFVTRAHNHGIYVIPTCDWIPNNNFYGNISGSNLPADVGGVNILLLSQGGIDAKLLWMQKLVQAIGSVDNGALLSTIFSWEIQNEHNGVATDPPFNLNSGNVTTADGNTYDMADATSRQACLDNNANNMINQVVAGIKLVDPLAMISSSVFTFLQVGRPGPTGLLPNDSGDVRFPLRPLKMLETDISFIDMHPYPFPSNSLTDYLESSEFSSMDLTLKPLLLGEFGAFKNVYPTIGEAASVVLAHRTEAFGFGFQGALHWTWDTPNQPEIWNALDAGGVVNTVLAPKGNTIRPDRNIDFIEEGSSLDLVAPNGTNYQWKKNGTALVDDSPRLTGVNSQTLSFNPILESDAGSYTCEYDNGALKFSTETEALNLTVLPLGTLPVAGSVVLFVLALLMVIVFGRAAYSTPGHLKG